MRLLAISNLPWDSCFPPGVGPRLGAERRTHPAEPEEIEPYLRSEFRARLECEGVGGSPTNVALTFAGLGGSAAIVGPVAEDAFGARVCAELEHHGIALHRVVPPPVAQAHSLAFREPRGERRFLATLPRLAGGTPGPAQAPGAAWDGPGWLVTSAYELSGGLGHLVLRAFADAHDAERPLAFDLADPYCVHRHPWMIREILAAGVDVLLTGEEGLAALDACGAAPARADSWHSLASTVLITRGAGGILASHDGREMAFEAPAVPVVDTTGAGDALLGGFLFGRSRGLAFEAAVGLGLAAAGACVQGLGARIPAGRWAALRGSIAP